MASLDTATLKSNHPIFDSFLQYQASSNFNLHAGRDVVLCFHGTGGNASTVGDWCKAAVHFGSNPEKVIIAPKSSGASGGWWQGAKSFNGISATDSEFTAAIAAGVALVDAVLAEGVPLNQIALMGHSQGGCLALEVALAKLDTLGPDAATPPDRFALVMATASGVVGMFQDSQSDCETHAWWKTKVPAQKFHLAAKSEDPKVPEFVSRYSALALETHCAGDVDYRVETVTKKNTHALDDGGFASEEDILRFCFP